MVPVSPDRFEELVADALDALPPELGRMMDNVAVFVDDDHEEGLLGLYEGIPLTEREDYGVGWGELPMPDRITVFRAPDLRRGPGRGGGGRAGADHRRARGRPPLRHRGRPPRRARLGLTPAGPGLRPGPDDPLSRGRGRGACACPVGDVLAVGAVLVLVAVHGEGATDDARPG